LIFGVVGLYLVILFTLQRRDVDRAAGATAKAGSTGGPAEIDNPTTMGEAELWAAMAVKPISPEAARARGAAWETARGSVNLGILICILIFAGVVPIYLFDTFVPFLICAPLIGLIAVWKGIRLLMPGGDVDKAYDSAGLAMEPLGLEISERPEVGVRPRPTPPGTLQTSVTGPLVMEGSRHGRRVSIVTERGSSEVTVKARAPEFETKARDGRIRLKDGPAAVRDALEAVPASQRWGGVKVHGGADGIVVTRRRNSGGDFLCDLWLAERVADRVAAGAR
jgi:hypothetical protein